MTVSQGPPDNPAAPVPYAPASTYAARPTSVTVLSIMGMVLGGMGLLCKPASLLMFVVKMPVPNPVVDAMRNDSFIRGFMVIGAATGWVISLLLILASVGSLRLRDWGRSGMLAYAGLALVMTAISQAIGIVAIAPALAPAVRQAAAEQPAAFQLSPAANLALGIGLGLWFPLLILYFYTRKSVKQAFEQGLPPAGAAI